MLPNSIYASLFYAAFGFYLAALLSFAAGWRRALTYLLLTGLILHTAFLINRASFTGIWIPVAFLEPSFFLPWCLAALAVGAASFEAFQAARSLVIPLSAVALAALLQPHGIMPPSPFSDTVFSASFFLFDVAAYALFIAAGWSSLMHLVFKNKSKGFHSLIVWGFVAYSIAQITGAVWSYLGWSTPFHWNPKHLQSACIWCFYAAVLHIRFMKQWNMKTEAGLSLAGLVMIAVISVWNAAHETGMQRIGG